MKMTVEEINHIDDLHDEIDSLLCGHEFSICLHALCSTIGGAGVHAKTLGASKQEFMAQVHECVSTWYDHYKDIIEKENQ
jgi:hypothetical protein